MFSVIMRREQIHKICLNHNLTNEIEYKAKDAKSWQFIANDFSEGTYEMDNFSLRFKTDEIARDFKRAIEDALTGNTSNVNENANEQNDIASNVTVEETRLIANLQLPNNFYDYKTQKQCEGCRGCSDEYVFAEVKDTNFGQVDDNPLPLIPPPKVELSHNDLSKDTKKTENKNTFSFTIGNDSKGNGNVFTGFGTTASADSAQTTGMFFGNSTFNSPFSAGKDNKDAKNTTPVFGQTSLFGGNVTKPPSAEAVQSKPSFAFNSTTVFGGNCM